MGAAPIPGGSRQADVRAGKSAAAETNALDELKRLHAGTAAYRCALMNATSARTSAGFEPKS